MPARRLLPAETQLHPCRYPTTIIPEEQVPIRVIGRMVLAAEAGLAQKLDEGCIEIAETADAKSFLAACADVQYWLRELETDFDANA